MKVNSILKDKTNKSTENEDEIKTIIRGKHKDPGLLGYLVNLKSYYDSFVLPDDDLKRHYGLPEVFQGIHRYNDCNGLVTLQQNCNCTSCNEYVKQKLYNRIVYTGLCNKCKTTWCSLFNLDYHCSFHRD